MPLGLSPMGSEATMEQEHDSRTSTAPGGISPCREYASTRLGEEGSLYIYGMVCLTEIMLMLALNWIMTRKYWQSGFWVPEKGTFWDIGSSTEDSSKSDKINESTDCSNSGKLEDR